MPVYRSRRTQTEPLFLSRPIILSSDNQPRDDSYTNFRFNVSICDQVIESILPSPFQRSF